MLKQKIEPFYNRHYKLGIIFPFVILLISFIIIGQKYSAVGDFMERDVSLKGGLSATLYTDKSIDINGLESSIKQNFPKSDITIRKLTDFSTGKVIGITIEATNVNADGLKGLLSEKSGIELTEENLSMEEVGSSLGESFYKELLYALIFAFLFMAIIIFVVFRTPIPCLAVILSAFTDIVATLAVIDLLGIKISSGGIAAFLMLIGYSVDTDILLTTRVLKRQEGSVFDRMYAATKPGLTMTIPTITAVFVGYLVSTSAVIQQIFLIILIGNIWDIINTWITNASILYWYTKKKNIQ